MGWLVSPDGCHASAVTTRLLAQDKAATGGTVRTIMSRNRFDQIWRYLHLSDNEARDATDKLYKIRWLIEYLNSRFTDVYCPYENFLVDESMTKFQDRLQFRQYLQYLQ